MRSKSHDFDDELKISFLILSSDSLSKTFIVDLIERIVSIFYPQNTWGNDHRVLLLM